MIEAMESNIARCDLVQARGYTLFPDYFIYRHKPLDPANLPPGFSIQRNETLEDDQLCRLAGLAVFGRGGTAEQDEFLK
jgi:hypothetical protein